MKRVVLEDIPLTIELNLTVNLLRVNPRLSGQLILWKDGKTLTLRFPLFGSRAVATDLFLRVLLNLVDVR